MKIGRLPFRPEKISSDIARLARKLQKPPERVERHFEHALIKNATKIRQPFC